MRRSSNIVFSHSRPKKIPAFLRRRPRIIGKWFSIHFESFFFNWLPSLSCICTYIAYNFFKMIEHVPPVPIRPTSTNRPPAANSAGGGGSGGGKLRLRQQQSHLLMAHDATNSSSGSGSSSLLECCVNPCRDCSAGIAETTTTKSPAAPSPPPTTTTTSTGVNVAATTNNTVPVHPGREKERDVRMEFYFAKKRKKTLDRAI